MQKVMLATLNLGELGEQPAPSPRGSVRAYKSNHDLWSEVLDQRIRAGRTITLKRFALSEWYPLTSGLFHTSHGRMSREYAQSHILGADDVGARTLAELEADVSVHTKTEWRIVQARDPTGEMGLLVPVLVRECKPRGRLKSRVRIDLLSLDEAAARHALLAGLDQARAKPSGAPAFPGGAAPGYPAG
jgi:hypothetical protein